MPNSRTITMTNYTQKLRKFISKMEVHESGCWIWMASKNKKGYGRCGLEGLPYLAHRASYELHIGQIPAKSYVLHSSDNPSCVNPEHLYIGDQFDNMRDRRERGRAKNGNTDKTHCPKGHPYSGQNLKIVSTTGHRRCRICNNERCKKYYHLRKSQ